jgi:ComF family protein
MHTAVNEWLRSIHGFLLPPHCVFCGARGQPLLLDLCAPCAADLPTNRNPCARCAVSLAGADGIDRHCGRCLARAPPFDRALAPYRYAYPLDHLVRRFKYQNALGCGRVLGTLLARHVAKHASPLPEALIPVPLHRERHRARGFNQAFEIARHLTALLEVGIDDRLCVRVRDTKDQTQLSARERRKNLRKAFEVIRAPPFAHVALVDDVLTTGSTAAELARVLKGAGVKRVEVWAVARAERVSDARTR